MTTRKMFVNHQGDVLDTDDERTEHLRPRAGKLRRDFLCVRKWMASDRGGWAAWGYAASGSGSGGTRSVVPSTSTNAKVRSELSSAAPSEREAAVTAWVDELYDIAGVRDVDREGAL